MHVPIKGLNSIAFVMGVLILGQVYSMQKSSSFPRTRRHKCHVFTFLIIFFFTFGLLFQHTQINQSHPLSLPRTADWRTPAPPITISSDAEWATNPWVNGSGTWEDPYSLQNLTIDAALGNGIYITNTITPFRISNCAITNAGSTNGGIYLNNAGNGTLFNNTCSFNNRGIYLWMAQNCTLVNNNCSENLVRGIVMLQGSHNNTLSGNICSKNQGMGIDIEDSGNISITWNTCTYNQPGVDGIYVQTSGNSIIVGNNCSNNGNHGLNLYAVTNSIIFNNTCSGNTNHGIIMMASSNNILDHNTCTGNNQNGMDFQAPCTSNQIVSNNCSGNKLDGIIIRASTSINNTVANNTCAWNNRAGIQLYVAQNLTIADNTCTGNNWTGIYLNQAINNTIRHNNCSGSNQTGIWLSYANNNTLIGNNCSRNANAGILLNGTNATFISGNTCFREGVCIVMDANSYGNDISYNWFRKFVSSMVIDDNPSYNNLHDNYKIYPPSASFNVNVNKILAGEEIFFYDTTTMGAAPLTYQWDFGDGTGTSTQQNPVHQFAIAGTWLVTLTVTDADGDVAVSQVIIFVKPPLGTENGIKMVTIAIILIAIVIAIIGYWFIRESRRKNKTPPPPNEDLEFD